MLPLLRCVGAALLTAALRVLRARPAGSPAAAAADSGAVRLFVSGIPPATPLASLATLFERHGGLLAEVSLRRGFGFLQFRAGASAAAAAAHALERLNGASLNGGTLRVEPAHSRHFSELSAHAAHAAPQTAPSSPDPAGSPIRALPARGRRPRGGASGAREARSGQADTAGRGEVGGGAVKGHYLVKLLRLCESRNPGTAPLLAILNRRRNNQAKEVSEAMAAAEAVLRLGKMEKLDLHKMRLVVFVPGDGHQPMTAAAICTSAPDSWKVYSIDPLMDYPEEKLGPLARKLSPVRSKLEEFEPPKDEVEQAELRLVVAVHSHAPLQQFYSELPSPKYCISLPCCGSCGFVADKEPFHKYEDNEVLSAKRTVYMWRD